MIPRIYIDVDGVVADFNLGITELLDGTASPENAVRLDNGETWKDVFGKSDTEVWSDIDRDPRSFWDSLYEIADRFASAPITVRLYDACAAMAEKTTFLTALPITAADQVAAAKIAWLRKRLGRSFRDTILCAKYHKLDLAAPGRVLIDDNFDNCTDFVEAGGGAVHYCAMDASLERVAKLVTKASSRNCLVSMKLKP